MTIEKALNLTPEEFSGLCDECKNFNDEIYSNHRARNEGESFGEFMEKGCYEIKDDPIIKGNLI